MFKESHVVLEGVLMSTLKDNLDGTGTRTFFNQDGTISSVEDVFDLPIELDQEARIAELEAKLDAALALLEGD